MQQDLTPQEQGSSASTDQKPPHKFSEGLSFEGFRQIMANFAKERDWDQYHTPRNLLLAFTGEVGELCELFQWKGEVKPGLPEFSDHEKTRVGEEMTDCLAYLFRLADQCEIDLTSAVLRKLALNAQKYPADKCKGKSDKYTAYQELKSESNSETVQEKDISAQNSENK